MSANVPAGGYGYGSGPSLRQFAAQCEARMRQGANRDDLLRQMTEAGCPAAEAERMITAAGRKLRSTAVKLLAFGALMFALGLFMTLATFSAAVAAGGGVFLLCYGAAISGVVCVALGIRSLVKLRGDGQMSRGSAPLPIDHLNRHVSDVGDFVAFYRGILGYELLRRGFKANGKPFAILRGEGHELFISEKDGFEPDAPGNFRHVGYAVPNADAMLAECKAKGVVEPEREIVVKPYSRQFYIRDPDGFELDLIEWTDKEGFYNHR